ncbi:MAG: hypothetical protein D6690_13125 [Nitrospirae bacterium]|nr:MAG: hypothetical protein D6690_13125 [Nitrospirota bacterium]
MTEAMRGRVRTLSSRLEGLQRPRVLYILNSQPLITVGPGSFIHHLIEVAGGDNIATDAHAPYPRINMEDVLRKNPEYILFPVGRFEGIPQDEQDSWKRWTDLSAVRHGRLYQIPSDLLNRPGPRVIDGLELLARTFHPEIFSDRQDAR